MIILLLKRKKNSQIALNKMILKTFRYASIYGKAKAHITTDVLVFIVKTCKAQRISFHLNNIQSAYNVYEKTMCKMKNQTKNISFVLHTL